MTSIWLSSAKRVVQQILSIVEKQITLKMRFKFWFIRINIQPIINFMMPLFLMGFLFVSYNTVGYWNAENYFPFLIIAYLIYLLLPIILDIPVDFQNEKFWGTLPSLLVSPVNRFTLLFGMLAANLVVIAAPFCFFLIFNFIIFPCSPLTLISILILFLAISITFLGIAAILCAFAIGNESVWQFLAFALTVVFFLSCINYPLEVFPVFVQDVIRLNPLYYFFDILRLVWMEDNILMSFQLHLTHFLIIIPSAIAAPVIGIKSFDIFIRKLEIQG